MSRRPRKTSLSPPFLRRVWMGPVPDDGVIDRESYPLSLPLVRDGRLELSFEKPVTIIVGENGSGKSTLLEAVATMAGFSVGGGSSGMRAVAESPLSGEDGVALGRLLRSSWLPKVTRGWFFRAETFFSVARYLDDVRSPRGGYLRASHGEGFLAFFRERLATQGLFILDEPESALSPAKQFEFLKLLKGMQAEDQCQLIMATHSPILMALPGADLWQIDRGAIRPTTLEETSHFQIYRQFVLAPHETIEAMTE